MTAAIDGQLTPTEARRLRRALAESAEARAVFDDLKADSERLRTLPAVTPPADLQHRILALVATLTPPPAIPTKPEPAAPSTLAFPARGRRWVPVAAAAALLLSVTVGSFLFFARQNGATHARNGSRPPPSTKLGAGDPGWSEWLPADNAPLPSAPLPRDRGAAVPPDSHEPETNPGSAVPTPEAIAQAPEPRPYRSPLIGAPLIPETKFDVVDVRIPFLRALADFDRAEIRQELAEELARDPAVRIDVFARNPVSAADALQAAAKATGIRLHADANTLTQLQKRNATAFVIYTESLTAEELAALFGRLCAEDAKFSPRLFDALHAVPVTDADVKDLKQVLGMDPGLFKRAAAERPDRPADPSKPISAGTADHIVKSVTGGASAGKPVEKSAVLLAWGPPNARAVTPPAGSAELKQFLSKRGERKSTALPAIIVIRQGNG